MVKSPPKRAETPPRVWGRPLPGFRKNFLEWKHPHGCGEDGRAWRLASLGWRNTPTGVGKTRADDDVLLLLQKHPHGCGEDVPFDVALQPIPETPPRVWGRQCVRMGLRATGRNTPTGVGKTARRSRQAGRAEKHPHGCGEDAYAPGCRQLIRETPPRVWGRQRDFIGFSHVTG